MGRIVMTDTRGITRVPRIEGSFPDVVNDRILEELTYARAHLWNQRAELRASASPPTRRFGSVRSEAAAARNQTAQWTNCAATRSDLNGDG